MFDLNFFQNKPNRLIALCCKKRVLHLPFVLEDFFVLFTKLPLRPVKKMERQYKSVVKSEAVCMWSYSSEFTLKMYIIL